jgi:hypothetical protein
MLSVPARLLHLALHAVQGGIASEQAVEDLARGIRMASLDDWQEAADLAFVLKAEAPLAVALSIAPNGAELGRELGVASTASTRWQLWAQSPPPGATRLQSILELPGIAAKARAVGKAIFPPRAYIEAVYPDAREDTGALVKVYARRVAAILGNAGGALIALWRARAAARRARNQ